MSKVCLMSEEPFLPREAPQYRGGRIFLSYAAELTDSFVISSGCKERSFEEEINGTKVYRVIDFHSNPLLRILSSIKLFFKSFSIIKREQPEIIFAKTAGCYLPAFLISKLLGVECKIHVGSFPKFKYIKIFLMSLPYDEIITVGEHLQKEIEKYSHAPVRVVLNGIDLSLFKSLKQKDCRKKLNLPKNDFIILYAGGFEKVKRIPFMIKLFKDFQRIHSDAKLLLVGEGTQKGKSRKLVQKFDLGNNVIFRSAQPHHEMKYYYSAADVLLLTSESEGGSPPRAVLEAMVCNTPAISVKQKDSQFLKGLGVKVAETHREYLEKLKEVYKEQPSKDLRKKIKQFDIKKQINQIFKNQ